MATNRVLKTPKSIRISIGSAAVLGLSKIRLDADPTTCYVMTYTDQQCLGRCSFCPQGTGTTEKSSEQLSRVQWPNYEWGSFLSSLKTLQTSVNPRKFKRLCLQVLNYGGFYEEVEWIFSQIHAALPDLKFSAALPPLSSEKMMTLHQLGLERIGIALDACNEKLFLKIKGAEVRGPYSWKKHWITLTEALEVFGKGKVTTHLIVGLGETEQELILAMNEILQKQILPGIFLFTPIKDTPMEHYPRTSIRAFRHVQLTRQLLLTDLAHFERFHFDSTGQLKRIHHLTSQELHHIVEDESAFKTAGCPDCNRPYYTSRPGEEQDGYPRNLTKDEKSMIFEELCDLIDS
ncbi:MAG: hypothetical protein ACTSWW_05035 [Promethearchaeota archaeon]